MDFFVLFSFLLSWRFTSIETIRLIGDGRMEVGKREIIYLSLHCHHQNDSCIKIGSDESHFNVSLIVRDNFTRQCPQTTHAGRQAGRQARKHARTHTHTHTHTHTRAHTEVRVRTHTNMRAHTHIHKNVRTHMQTTQICAHTHAHRAPPSPFTHTH